VATSTSTGPGAAAGSLGEARGTGQRAGRPPARCRARSAAHWLPYHRRLPLRTVPSSQLTPTEHRPYATSSLGWHTLVFDRRPPGRPQADPRVATGRTRRCVCMWSTTVTSP
jgi:hypothetical protein